MEARRLRILDRQRQATQGWRETLAIHHLLATILGLVIASIGAYLITGNVSRTTSTILLFTGTTMALISFLAWFGAGQGNAVFLKVHCMLVIFFVVLQVLVLGWLYYEYSKDPSMVDQLGSDFWDFFWRHDDHFLKDLEQTFHCCGYRSTLDRVVPLLGCKAGNLGCKTKWIQIGQEWPHSLVIGLVVFLMIQVCLLLMTVVTCILVEKETIEEETENQVQKQHVIRFGWLPTDGGGNPSGGGDYDPSGGNSTTGGTSRYNNNTRINRRSQPPPHYGSLA